MRKKSKQKPIALPDGGGSGRIFVTGQIIAFFLVVHVADMRLKKNPFIDFSTACQDGCNTAPNEFVTVQLAPTNWTSAAYVIGLVALGLNHPRWNQLLELTNLLFAWVIAFGFLSLVVWAALTSGARNRVSTAGFAWYAGAKQETSEPHRQLPNIHRRSTRRLAWQAIHSILGCRMSRSNKNRTSTASI